jgi:hypothetical protein
MGKPKRLDIRISRAAEKEHYAVSGAPGSGRNILAFTPQQFVEEVEGALPLSTPQEQKRLLEHAKAWAIVWHNGNVPEALNQQLKTLEERYGNA